jgi:mannose-6-phosphate isomerase
MNTQEKVAFLLDRARAEARGYGMAVDEANSDSTRPWGGFLRLRETSYREFLRAYWWDVVDVPSPEAGLRLDPKILVVAPGARLSLQYHHYRSEHWRCLEGPVGVVHGTGPEDLCQINLFPGDIIRLPRGRWHRLVGLEGFGRIAEIWENTDPDHPSSEGDIVRVEDDFGR